MATSIIILMARVPPTRPSAKHLAFIILHNPHYSSRRWALIVPYFTDKVHIGK